MLQPNPLEVEDHTHNENENLRNQYEDGDHAGADEVFIDAHSWWLERVLHQPIHVIVEDQAEHEEHLQ